MKCIRKFNKNGEPTKWYQIYNLLKQNGPMKKKQILDAIWPNRGYFDKYYNDWDMPVERGFCCKMFSAMHKKGIVNYNRSTKLWSAGVID